MEPVTIDALSTLAAVPPLQKMIDYAIYGAATAVREQPNTEALYDLIDLLCAHERLTGVPHKIDNDLPSLQLEVYNVRESTKVHEGS